VLRRASRISGSIYTSYASQKAKVWLEMGEGSSVEYLPFDPDGKTLASLLSSGEGHLWDVKTGKPAGAFQSPVT